MQPVTQKLLEHLQEVFSNPATDAAAAAGVQRLLSLLTQPALTPDPAAAGGTSTGQDQSVVQSLMDCLWRVLDEHGKQAPAAAAQLLADVLHSHSSGVFPP